jgi:hypothetical protein
MARKCNHGKGFVLFRRKTGKEKEGKKIKECMQLRKIGMCEVMKVKAMEDGFNTRMINQL